MQAVCYLAHADHGFLRINGEQTQTFLQTMTTAIMTGLAETGDSVEALILSGEAEVIDKVTLIRTGDEEFMVVTSPGLHCEVFDWLKAHSTIADASGPIFPDVNLSDETTSLTALTLFGPASTDILQELSAGTLLSTPQMGNLRLVRFDTVTAMVFTPEHDEESIEDQNRVYQLFCSPIQSEGLCNALLSFPEIDILDSDEYLSMSHGNDPWLTVAEKDEYYYPDTIGLMHLIRSEYDFVGGKALAKRLTEE